MKEMHCWKCGGIVLIPPNHPSGFLNCPKCLTRLTIPAEFQPQTATNNLQGAQVGATILTSHDGQAGFTEGPAEGFGETAFRLGKEVGKRARTESSTLLEQFQKIKFFEEIFPLNAPQARRLARQPSFWAIMALASLPLSFVTLNSPSLQLTAFAIYFALIWGIIFRFNVVPDATIAWKWLFSALFFTGMIGIPVLLNMVYPLLPKDYLTLVNSDSAFIRLVGFIFQVGVWEELIKIVPVLLLLKWKGASLRYPDVIMLGIFSGLGFAAFENLGYGESSIARTIQMADMAGYVGVAHGVQIAMSTVLVRSISCVFGHAVYSGIFAHFLAIGRNTGVRRLSLAVAGGLTAAAIHGIYDACWSIQALLPTIVTVIAFMLFKIYLEQGSRIDQLLHSVQPGPETELMDETASDGDQAKTSVPQ